MKHPQATLPALFLLLYVNSALSASYSGFTETTMQLDNTRLLQREFSLEQWNELIYTNREERKQYVMQFALEAGVGNPRAEIHQLYARTLRSGDFPEMTIGRFDYIDDIGYYTLDGVSIKNDWASGQWHLFAGASRRLENYTIDSTTGILVGAMGQYQHDISPRFGELRRVTGRAGLQQHRGDQDSLYLSLGISAAGEDIPGVAGLRHIGLSGNFRMDESRLDSLSAISEFDLESRGRLNLIYEQYQPKAPEEEPQTFRERFYFHYASGRQALLKARWDISLTQRTHVTLEGIRTWRWEGYNGYGLATALTYSAPTGWKAETRLDYLDVDGDDSTTIYALFNKPLSARLKFEAEGVVQRKSTRLSGSDHTLGGAFRIRRRLRSDLYLSLSGEYLHHSDRQEEYRFGISLRYDFYRLPWGDKS